ncbi:MAG: hypothetical protein FWC85_05155 [Elusimicrobia bacterium]|nr:hypothetical protein [Elusimicrobiota bacterium]
MVKTNAQHFRGALSSNFFLRFKKKFVALFIVGVMAVNGFMPNALNVNRHSAVIIAGITAYSMVTSLFRDYNQSIANISQKVTEGLVRLIRKQADASEGTFAKSSNTAERQTPDAAAGYFEEGNYKALIRNERAADVSVGTFAGGFSFEMAQEYRRSKEPPGTAMPILLSFLIFIIGFISRKGIESASINTIIIRVKKEIAAFSGAAVSFFAIAYGGNYGK